MGEDQDEGKLATVAAEPCKSCPYRRDAPSGFWHPDEYAKLPAYDGEILDQVVNGGTSLFFCHQLDGRLCAGWVACHGTDHTLAFRLHGGRVDPSVFDATFETPVFSSGAEAAAHGMRDVAKPSEAAARLMDRLARKRRRMGLVGDLDDGY